MTAPVWGSWWSVLLVQLLVLCVFQSWALLETDQPRIQTVNGDLKLISGQHGDIVLQSGKRGAVIVNGVNLMRTLQLSANVTYRPVDVDGSSLLSQLDSAINGPSGLLARVAQLESGNATGSGASTTTTNYLRQRVAFLTRRINQLDIALRRLRNALAANECASNPCRNGGTCEDKYSGFICRCPSNWQGTLCDVDVNECANFAGTDLGCQNGATCVNKPGTYECHCKQGYFGVHCTQQSDDCARASASELCGHGHCQSRVGGGFDCLCHQGWTKGNGVSCTQDVDECASSSPACSRDPPVPCINVPGSFHCGSCPTGYTGNGFYCLDINECDQNNGGCSVQPFVQCINTKGSRRCGECPAGYQGDGITCMRTGICSINNGGCHILARCLENAGISQSYAQCICPSGYAGDGIGPNGCLPVQSPSGQNPCANNPCGSNGQCVPAAGNTYSCNCYAGFTGVRCTQTVDTCSPNPCQNGGTCMRQGIGAFTCVCPSSYTGLRCQDRQQRCGGLLTNEAGVLTFPDESAGSANYPHGVSCAWVIITNNTKVLNVTFTNFHLEGSAGCTYDWLQVHDGRSAGDQLIGRFCGNTPPKGGHLISTHNALYLWFRSDGSVSRDGFSLTWNSVEPVCGGGIEVRTHGTLTSPGSPGNYPRNRDCAWIMRATNSRRIQFHFFSLRMENHTTCSFDYLKFYDGLSEHDPVFAQFCNSSEPEPLLSPGSTVMIRFHSDNDSSDTGFQISYSAVPGIPGCGGTLTAGKGTVTTPNYPQNYPANIDCEWSIRLPQGERIKIEFTDYELEDSRNCMFDFVEIRDGSSEDSALIGRYCGVQKPATFISNGNKVYVRFRTDLSINRKGFSMNYNAVCGGIISAPSGIIHSPMYPNVYPSNKYCIWEIEQPLGSAIQLTFSDFDIEASIFSFRGLGLRNRACPFDSLEIHDGHSKESPLIGRYCGNKIPPPIISTYNHLWMEFKTDASRQHRGFLANYTTIDTTCGGILKAPNGTLESPNYPNSYIPGQICRWILAAPPGKSIQLTWDSFALEDLDGCFADYIEVYDNSSLGTSKMGRFCGETPPPVLTSVGNIMTVLFESDTSINYQGFSAHYTQIDTSMSCGHTFHSSVGAIQSPGYPQRYLSGRDCTWIISVPAGQQIMLNVTDFELEESSCKYDYLEIRNGGNAQSPLVGKFCGTNIPRRIPSHSHLMYLHFVSDFSIQKKGFRITWDGTATGCGGTLTSPSGTFTSPNYPQTYNEYAHCTWKISTSKGSILQLVFIDIDMEELGDCYFDNVEVRDGKDSSGRLIGTYCSSNHPANIHSTSNHLFITFTSDFSGSGRGFHAKYDTICNTDLRGFRGVIESPNFPEMYPNSLDCTWNIHSLPGHNVSIQFSHFELQGYERRWLWRGQQSTTTASPTCKLDYLEIKESFNDDTTQNLLLKACGSTIPEPVQSRMNTVQVHFHTDEYTALSGFRLEWVVKGCGGHLERPFGEFTSPGYPGSYPDSVVCEWLISVEWGNSVQLTIEDFSMEHTPQCSFDSLTIYGGIDTTAPQLVQICHSQKSAMNYTSSGNNMYLRFVSDASFSGRGFKASYKSVPSRCGGHLSTPKGSIHSANYPNNYDHNDDCMWLIEVGPTHRINFTLIDMEIESSTDCYYDYLEVYDGKTADNETQLLTKVCGSDLPQPSWFISTSNSLVVRFKSDGSRSSKGFIANYSVICGARIVTEDSGIISLENYINSAVDLNRNCSWTIVGAKPDDRVTLTITHIDFSQFDTPSCDLEYVEIRDGENINATLLGRYCGSNIPPHLTSHGNAIFITVATSQPTHTGLFTAIYSVTGSGCGGNLTSESGSFASPGFPGSYPLNVECIWTIKTSPGNNAVMTFSQFSLGGSTANCDEDYVEVRRDNGGGPLIGLYCSDSALPSNLTAAHSIWVKFRSGPNGPAGTGFLASYQLVHGNNLEGESGQIASPLYPLPYTKLAEFSWRITVNFSYVISVTFKDLFIPQLAENCWFSYLMIYDGYDESAPTQKKYCGGRIPEPFTSTSNVIYVTMSTLPLQDGSYFFLEWLQVESISETTSDFPLASGNETGCGSVIHLGETLNTSQVNISTPNFGSGYNAMTCIWIIETPPTSHAAIKIRTLDVIAYSGWCQAVVKIYKGQRGTQDWLLIEETCLSNATALGYIHGSSLVKIVFQSNYESKDHAGFAATVYTDCGGTLDASTGVLEYNSQIPALLSDKWSGSIECQWNVTVPAGRNISVSFDSLQIPASEHGKGCGRYEFLMLKNGGSDDSQLLGTGKFCGSKPTEVLQTTGNKLFVRFVGYQNSEGFKLRFQQVTESCGGSYRLNIDTKSVTISSPRYPQVPPPHIECIYVFTAPAGENLQIEFDEHFDLRGHSGAACKEEGVEIRDGGTLSSKVEGLHCGTVAPNTYTSSSNILHVRFYTDTNSPHTGFKATVSLGKCGGTIRGNRGVIKSPGYPGKYDRNLHCEWYVRATYDYYYTLNFQLVDLDMPGYGDCSDNDNVTISQILPFNDTAVALATYCGDKDNVAEEQHNLHLTFSRALVVFKTSGNRGSSSYPYKGFRFTYNATFNRCSQELTGSEGEITSHGYPTPKDRSQACEYIITVPIGRRISLDVLDIDLSQSLLFNQPSSYLTIYEGTRSSLFITRLTAKNISAHVEASGNKVSIYYYTRSTVGHRGFKIRFSSTKPAVCGGLLTDNGGLISSPTGQATYYCEWHWFAFPKLENQTVPARLIVPKTFTLTLLNVTISGPDEGYCRWFTPSMFIVSGEMSILMCKNVTTPQYISIPMSQAKIMVKQPQSRTMSFSMQYSVSNCGAQLFGPEENVTSPMYPTTPPKNTHCAWAVTYPDGQRVKVHFLHMDISGGPSEQHYFAIHNGKTVKSPQIVHLTPGTTSATDIISETNSIWIEYHTGPNPTNTGFSLHLSPVISGCGGILHDANRELVSPNYPKPYTSNSECDWEIRVVQGYHVNLTFIERFQLENSTNCQHDYVEVFDYVASVWVSLGRICGRAGLQTFRSTGNFMRVIFRSDGAVNGDGFKALWSTECGGIITNQTSGTIMSPGYPDLYAPRLVCNYTILAPGNVIEGHFMDFNLEEGIDGCNFDNVTIYGRFKKWENKLSMFGTYCGREMPTTIYSRERLSIVFMSDRYISKTGFLFKYDVYQCGGVITTPSLLKSPASTNFESDYTMLNCTWQIVAPVNKIILLRFTEFDMPIDSQCYYSSSRIEVYNGMSAELSGRLGLFCSNLTNALPVVTSTNNTMTMSFITYPTQMSAKFAAEVIFMYGPSQGCGGIIHVSNTPQTIQSLDIDHNGKYENFLDCHWILLANQSNIIHLEFESFNIERCHEGMSLSILEDKECRCDYIEVRDGGGQFSELLGKFCGNQIPQKIITSSDRMWVRFVSDGTFNAAGFAARVFQRATPCGHPILNVTTERQVLLSPGYPGNYPANIRCRWIISGPPYESINIHVVDLQINGSGANCEDASLSIVDKKNAEYVRDGLGEMMVYSGKQREVFVYGFSRDPISSAKFCGTVQPMDFYSGTGDVELSFRASSEVARGFKLLYSTTGCNRNYSNGQGRIHFEKFPISCTMVISAPTNNSISLYVSDFYMGGDCAEDNLKVYDGSSTSAQLLSTMCGYTLPDPAFSTGPLMLLQLTKSSPYSINSIDLTYTTTDKGQGCGGKLFNTAGTFTSPMYPTNFRKASDCKWEVSVPRNLRPYLTFKQFSIGSRATCTTDYLEFYDKDEATGEMNFRTKYCGEDNPAQFEGATTTTVVRYVTSVHNGGSGWMLHFVAKHPETTIRGY